MTEQISSTNLSKETLDISNLDPTETLDELLEELPEQDLHQKDLGTSSNTNESDDVHKSTESIRSNKNSESNENGGSNENDASDEDRESLLFQNNLKYDVDRDVSDMMTKPFKRTSGYELPKRYTYTELLGLGGMGEVIRVKDDGIVQICSNEDHSTGLWKPQRCFVSVSGRSPNNCPTLSSQHYSCFMNWANFQMEESFFTMKEVDGDTLDDVIADLHLATKVLPQESEIPVWGESDQGFAFRDVIDIIPSGLCSHRLCTHTRSHSSRFKTRKYHDRFLWRSPRHGLGNSKGTGKQEFEKPTRDKCNKSSTNQDGCCFRNTVLHVERTSTRIGFRNRYT